jgi:hypothetical protein
MDELASNVPNERQQRDNEQQGARKGALEQQGALESTQPRRYKDPTRDCQDASQSLAREPKNTSGCPQEKPGTVHTIRIRTCRTRERATAGRTRVSVRRHFS